MYSNFKMKKIKNFWCLKDCSVNQSIFIMGEPAPNAGYSQGYYGGTRPQRGL